MADGAPTGCVTPAEGPIQKEATSQEDVQTTVKEEKAMGPMVGKEAPDFAANAYHEGGFKSVKLSDYRGKWVFLCFYPGDFTFV